MSMANLSVRSVDDALGPFFEIPGRRDFDFTLLFEDTILSILPAVVLLLAAPLRMVYLGQSSRKVATTKLRDIKIVCSTFDKHIHPLNKS